MHCLRILCFASLWPGLLGAGCGDPRASQLSDAAVALPDGAQPGTSRERLVVSEGTAGNEHLSLLHDGQRLRLSSAQAPAWCGDKVFCNMPPNAQIGRFPFVDFADENHIVYLDLNAVAWNESKVVQASLSTGTQVNLAALVPWPQQPPEWPLHYVAAAAVGKATGQAARYWFSLPVAGGMRLFHTDGSSPLQALDYVAMPTGYSYMESALSASAHGAVWTVRWRRLGTNTQLPTYRYTTFVYDATGRVVVASEPQTPAVAVIPGAVAVELGTMHGTIVGLHWVGANGGVGHIALYDVVARQFVATAVGPAYLYPLPGHTPVVIAQRSADNTIVIDPKTGRIVDEFVGQPEAVDGQMVRYRNLQLELIERNWTTKQERVIADATTVSANARGGVLSPDRKQLALVDGELALDLSENVGLRIVDLQTLALTRVEPPAASERFVRSARFSADGQTLYYLHPAGEALQLWAYDVAKRKSAPVGASSQHVRAFWLLP